MKKVTGSAWDIPVLKRVFGFVRPYRRVFIITLLLTVLLAALGPVRPWLTQLALDKFIAENDLQGLLYLTIAMILVLLVQSFVQFYHFFLSNSLGQLVIRDMRIKLFGHILNFPVLWFDKTPIGTTVTRTISDMETVADVFSDGIIVIIGDLLQLTVIIGFMFYIDWQLTIFSLCTIPFLMLATNIFKNKIKKTFNDVRTQVAALNNFVQEHITGMKIVQMFNREPNEMSQFRAINKNHRDANIRAVWYYSIFFPVVEILSAISIGLLVWWGAGEVIEGKTSFGTLVAFIMYINLLFRPIRELADKFNTLQMGMVSSERIFKVFDTPSAEAKPSGIKAERFTGEIEFKNVWFAYHHEDWVLKDVSFKVVPGQTLAFVGATGSGKSTIINLINRFYETSKGEILIDGINIKDYEVYALRRNIAVVLQDVFLFSDSVANNITLGDTDVSMDQVKQAASVIGADSFIDKLPGGYDFHVGERGNMLSMGQRQLIAFIRAYVSSPSILVLDEATSSIDSESEELITKATAILTKNRTSIVIAHRIATIQNADQIIVLDHGRIVESGTHTELLKSAKHYYKLFRIQFESHS